MRASPSMISLVAMITDHSLSEVAKQGSFRLAVRDVVDLGRCVEDTVRGLEALALKSPSETLRKCATKAAKRQVRCNAMEMEMGTRGAHCSFSGTLAFLSMIECDMSATAFSTVAHEV